MTDTVADYLTRVRNAIKANHRIVEVPASNLKKEITKILFEKGYILNYKFDWVVDRSIFNNNLFVKRTIYKCEIVHQIGSR